MHIELILAILFFGLAAVGAIVLFLRRMRDPLPPVQHHDRPDWFKGTALVIAVFAVWTWMDERDARHFAEIQAQRAHIRAGYLPPELARIDVDINRHCPPRSDGMTDQLLMVIVSAADRKPAIAGCSRVAERQYIIKRDGVRG